MLMVVITPLAHNFFQCLIFSPHRLLRIYANIKATLFIGKSGVLMHFPKPPNGTFQYFCPSDTQLAIGAM